jgi:hypothetical protein
MSRTDEALGALVERGTITQAQLQAVQDALESAGQAEHVGRRRVMSEILGYVGGAVIIVSVAFIIAQAWDPLGSTGRAVLFAAISAVLFTIGWILGHRLAGEAGRRLSATLMTAAAPLLALAIGIELDWLLDSPLSDAGTGPGRAWMAPFVLLCAAAAAGCLAFIGYRRCHSALGNIVMGIATGASAFSVGWLITAVVQHTSDAIPTLGLALLIATGATWLILSLRGTFHERVVGQFVGMGAMLVGVQGLRDTFGPNWSVPAIILAGGLLLMVVYALVRQWPLLVGGVAGVILGGSELLISMTEGIVAAASTLALGLAMLAAGVVLLRERRPPG